MARLGDSLDDDISVGISDVVKDEFEKVRGAITFTCKSSGTDTYMWIAPQAVLITSIMSVHTASSTGAGVIDVQKCHSTGDAEMGSTGAHDLQSTGFDMTTTGGVVETATLTTTTADLTLASGDRLGLNYGGSFTSVTNTCIVVEYYQMA